MILIFAFCFTLLRDCLFAAFWVELISDLIYKFYKKFFFISGSGTRHWWWNIPHAIQGWGSVWFFHGSGSNPNFWKPRIQILDPALFMWLKIILSIDIRLIFSIKLFLMKIFLSILISVNRYLLWLIRKFYW